MPHIDESSTSTSFSSPKSSFTLSVNRLTRMPSPSASASHCLSLSRSPSRSPSPSLGPSRRRCRCRRRRHVSDRRSFPTLLSAPSSLILALAMAVALASPLASASTLATAAHATAATRTRTTTTSLSSSFSGGTCSATTCLFAAAAAAAKPSFPAPRPPLCRSPLTSLSSSSLSLPSFSSSSPRSSISGRRWEPESCSALSSVSSWRGGECGGGGGGGVAGAAGGRRASDNVGRGRRRSHRQRRAYTGKRGRGGGRWMENGRTVMAGTCSPFVSVLGGGFQTATSSESSLFASSSESLSVEGDGEDEGEIPKDVVDVPMWPCFDELDRNLIKISLPCIANFAINPLIGAVDLFWINRMGNALAVAGQAAANQVFNSAFWIFSFLPSVTATLVSKVHAEGDEDGLQDAVCQALVVGFVVAMLGFGIVYTNPDKVLSTVLHDGSKAMEFARPYLLIRSFSFLPNLTSLIGYSAFRGVLDTVTPMMISAFANIFNALLDPILIFPLGMGVTGAALATLAAEIISAVTFVRILLKRNMIRWSKLFRIPDWTRLEPLLRGGLALQLRNFALNLTFLAVTRVTQSIDDTGVAAAAHALAIQTFQVGGIVLLALSTVAQTVVPNELIERVDAGTGKRTGGRRAAKAVVNRLMSWGFVLGVILGAVQIVILPLLLRASPLEEVRRAALVPSYLASVYQLMNGLVFIGEGVMVGCGNFMHLSLGTMVATLATLVALRTFPKVYGITGVWMGFGVFNSLRLAAVWLHQTRNGPIASRNLDKTE